MTAKKMAITVLVLLLAMMIAAASLVVLFDPYFHYHAPFSWQTYQLYDQRYQNDGIARNFEYNAIITGTSMTENFSATQCDELFGVNTIKIPYFGASYKEINQAVVRAIDRNPDIKMVVRSFDTYKVFEDKDHMSYTEYPEYLYDDNHLNDVKYLLNKDVLIEWIVPAMLGTLRKAPSTTFDEYANWDSVSVYGKEAVLKGYIRAEEVKPALPLTEQDKQTIRDNVYQNMISVAEDNPQIEFYYFIPPYSVVFWDNLNRQGDLVRSIEAQRLAVDMMLEHENIHIYSFATDFETVTDLNMYKDTNHYRGMINDKILGCMADKEYLITKSNVEEHFETVYDFYSSYDYDSIFD